jgi:predicted lipid-binding transport protein (Tim44 family)
VIAIESELAVREANLESLQQQQAALGGQVALSTVSLTLTAVTKDGAVTEPDVTGGGFIAGLTSGWAALLGFLGGLAGVFGAVLPFLPLIAAGVLLIWWVVRRARRRSRSMAGSAAPGGGAATATGDGAAAAPAGERQDAAVGAGVGSG